MAKKVIELDDVWKIFRVGDVDVPALRGLSLFVKENEFVAVRGPSGSGKSTTFNLIGCLDLPSKGRVLLDSVNISHMNETTLARIRGKKIGFVFQTFNLIPSLNALENVSLPAMFHDVNQDKMREKAKSLLTMVGLGHRFDHKPAQLSGGERQRVAIARALINDPEVILADEPTGNLDSKTGETIMDVFRELHEKQKKTIVMVTHEEDIAKHAKRKIYIKDGMVVE
jgi:putative ABC transport system ATP-binding protein